MAKAFYSPSSIKRFRRTKANIGAIEAALYEVLEANNPMTVRQCFYALTVAGIIEKTEAEYGTVVRLLSKMRREGSVPYSWLSDSTRWIRKPQTYTGLANFINETSRFYRRDLWFHADVDVQIWCEKDALAGVLYEETAVYGVDLMVTRGFSSETYLQGAAEAIVEADKPTYVYQFGDHDPSGVWIARKVEEGLRRHAPDAEIHYERVAVTREQIEQWKLPSRPTKKEGNNHAKDFVGDSVELDAIPALELRRLVRECIEQHVDFEQVRTLQVAEESERELIRSWASAAGIGGAR